MSCIRVNDIFDELFDENKRVKQCLKVLIEYKNFVDFVFEKIKTNLDSNDSQKFEEINKRTEEVFKTNYLYESLNNNKDIHLNDNKNYENTKTHTKSPKLTNKC